MLIKLQSHPKELATVLYSSVNICSVCTSSSCQKQQTTEETGFKALKNTATTGLTSQITFWARMLYSVLVDPSMKIIGKFREIEKGVTELDIL